MMMSKLFLGYLSRFNHISTRQLVIHNLLHLSKYLVQPTTIICRWCLFLRQRL